MKKLFFLLFVLFGVMFSANAQMAYITSVDVITSNGTFERSKVYVKYALTSEGMKEVYENHRDLEIIVSADITVSPFLQSATRSDYFYPVDNGNGRRKDGHLLEFECVDHDAALRLSDKGVSSSEFSIRTRLH